MSDAVHTSTVSADVAHVEGDLLACRHLPLVSGPGGCAAGADASGGTRPTAGQYSSSLANLLSMADRRVVDRTAYSKLVADAIVRQQRAVTEVARG